MKLENYDAVIGKVDQIRNLEKILDQLSAPTIIVTLKDEQSFGTLMTIGCYSDKYEHSYSAFAGEFIDRIKQDIQNQIHDLKQDLLYL